MRLIALEVGDLQSEGGARLDLRERAGALSRPALRPRIGARPVRSWSASGSAPSAPFVGSVVSYQIVSLGLAAGVNPTDLKLVTVLFALATLAISGGARRGAWSEPKINA